MITIALEPAYGDYDTMATLTRELIQGAARHALGGTVLQRADGTETDIGGAWRSVPVWPGRASQGPRRVTGNDARRLLIGPQRIISATVSNSARYSV